MPPQRQVVMRRTPSSDPDESPTLVPPSRYPPTAVAAATPPPSRRPLKTRRPLRLRTSSIVSAALGATLMSGCEVVALSVETGTGTIVVRLEDDGHDRRDPWRMRVRQAGQPDRTIEAAPPAPLELTVLTDVPVELTLFAPPGCLTLGPNPRTVEPAEDATVAASFAVRCTR